MTEAGIMPNSELLSGSLKCVDVELLATSAAAVAAEEEEAAAAVAEEEAAAMTGEEPVEDSRDGDDVAVTVPAPSSAPVIGGGVGLGEGVKKVTGR